MVQKLFTLMGLVWRRLAASYRRFGTTYWSHLPRVKQSCYNYFTFEDGTYIVLKYRQPTTNLGRGTYQKSKYLKHTAVLA